MVVAGVEPQEPMISAFSTKSINDLAINLEELDQMTVWAVVSRYPTDENLLSSETEIRRAADMATELLQRVRSRLGL